MPGVSVTFSGKLFTEGPPIIRQMGHNFVQELVEKGQERLAQMLSPRPQGVFLSVLEAGKGKASKGNYRRNLNARTMDLRGIIHDGGVVYGPWLEGTSGRNQTTRFKGYRSFRQTAQYMQGLVPALSQKWAHRAVEALNR